MSLRCALALIVTLMAVATPRPAVAQELEHELIEREREWAQAMREKNAGALWEILAEEFVLTGTQTDRADPIRKEGWLLNTLLFMEFGEIEIHDVEVFQWGDVGLVRFHMSIDWSMGSQKLPPAFHLTDLWIHREGRWQVVTRVSEDATPR